MYGCLMGAVHGLWKRRQYGEIRDIALSEAAAGWNACQASMHAQLDEKNREIIRIAKLCVLLSFAKKSSRQEPTFE